jgi:hypothetical protein
VRIVKKTRISIAKIKQETEIEATNEIKEIPLSLWALAKESVKAISLLV